MTMPKVTVALSAYNVGEYLSAAIDAILAQTFSDFELLCIDDASTDATADIMERYAASDARVRVIRMPENRGLAVSRNIALAEANGEWVLMVDGDDLMHPELLARALAAAEDSNAQMVMWDYCEFIDESEISEAASAPSRLSGLSVTDRQALLRCMSFTWIRLIKTETMRRLGITYPEGRTKQDIPAHWREILGIERIAILPERLSYYRQRAGATSRRRGASLFDHPAVLDIVEEDLRAAGRYEVWADELARQRIAVWGMLYTVIDKRYRSQARDGIRLAMAGDCGRYIHSHRAEIPPRWRILFEAVGGDSVAIIKQWCIQSIVSLKHKLHL